jgi:hypothetical protein
MQKLTPSEILEKVALELHHLCNHEQEIIEVNIEAVERLFFRKHRIRSIVRHRRNPDRIFDRSRDESIVLEPELHRRVNEYAKQFVNVLRDFNSGTICVYIDGNWSYGGASKSA